MIAIRRNKYGKLMYATGVANNHITHLATDPTSAVQLDEPTARAVVDAHKARNNPAAGRIEAVDAKGKVIAAAGEPGEEPKPVVPPVSLPGLAERVRVVEERVEMIEAADAPGGDTNGGLAKLMAELKDRDEKQIRESLAKVRDDITAMVQLDLRPEFEKLVKMMVENAVREKLNAPPPPPPPAPPVVNKQGGKAPAG